MRLPSLSTKLTSILIKSVISGAVLGLIFYYIPFASVLRTVRAAYPVWVISGASLMIMLRVLTAIRMQLLARSQGLQTNGMMMMRIVFTSTFYNLLAPGTLAGGAVTYLKYRQEGVAPVAAMANIYANKAMQMLVVLLSAPLLWLIDKGFHPGCILGYTIVMVVGFAGAFSLFFGRFGNLCWLEARISRHGQSAVHQALTKLCRQVALIGGISHRLIFILVIFSVLHSLCAALGMLFFGKALGIELGLTTVLWIYSAVYLLGMLPISVSNIGVREAGMIMLMLPYGVSMTEATAWSVLMYSGTLCCALIGTLLETKHFWLGKKYAALAARSGRQQVQDYTINTREMRDDDSSG